MAKNIYNIERTHYFLKCLKVKLFLDGMSSY